MLCPYQFDHCIWNRNYIQFNSMGCPSQIYNVHAFRIFNIVKGTSHNYIYFSKYLVQHKPTMVTYFITSKLSTWLTLQKNETLCLEYLQEAKQSYTTQSTFILPLNKILLAPTRYYPYSIYHQKFCQSVIWIHI